MRANLDIMGMYEYYPQMFSELELPPDIRREDFILNLCMETSELEVLYPSPIFMEHAIGAWSRKQKPIWDKLAATTKFEYNPIHNYDRTETETDKINNEFIGNVNGMGQNSNSGIDTHSQYKAGFNSTEPVVSQRDEDHLGTQVNTTHSTDTNNTATSDHSRTMKASGNIGVTTTQEMIAQERECVKYNLMDVIIQEFKTRFCLLVY